LRDVVLVFSADNEEDQEIQEETQKALNDWIHAVD